MCVAFSLVPAGTLAVESGRVQTICLQGHRFHHCFASGPTLGLLWFWVKKNVRLLFATPVVHKVDFGYEPRA